MLCRAKPAFDDAAEPSCPGCAAHASYLPTMLSIAAAAKRGRGERYTREATFAKVHASEMVGRVTDHALQIHGGYGYSRDMPLERYMRDARIARIFDGSSEIYRNLIARMILAV